MTVTGSSSAQATATAVLPTAVGPTSTGVRGRMSGPSKPSLQLFPRKPHDGRPPVHVVGGEGGREQPPDQLARLRRLETLSGLDRGAARERRREPLQPVRPSPEPSPREIGHELP